MSVGGDCFGFGGGRDIWGFKLNNSYTLRLSAWTPHGLNSRNPSLKEDGWNGCELKCWSLGVS
eukprot:2123800-Amphidinium_carterae.1